MKQSFIDLGINEFLIECLKNKNITEPVEIQKLVIPPLFEGEDLLFRSATGTGKTYAYLLPVLNKLLAQKKEKYSGPKCIILAPTYELAAQIKSEADFLLSETEYKTALLIGSANTGRSIETLKKDKPILVAGNPGRLLNLAKINKLRLNEIEYLILDEGDRLVSDELIEETSAFISLTSRFAAGKFQFITCSATFNRKNRDRLFKLLNNRQIKILETKEDILKNKIEHWAIYSEERDKANTLRALIAAGRINKALIFTAKGRQVGNIVSRLLHYKLSAAGLWGEMEKKIRKASLDGFRTGKIKFLVTSDLAARGLDISDVNYVIALDTIEEAEAYIHRSGRTGRAGKKGVMISIGSEGEMRRLSAIEKKLGIIVYPKELYKGKIIAPEEETT